MAAQLDALAALPPSLKKRMPGHSPWIINANNDTSLSTPFSLGDALEEKNAFITAFVTWEKMIRDLGRPVPGIASTTALPPAHQTKEDLVNYLLEFGSLISNNSDDQLNTLIEPYWEPQLRDLREKRKLRLLDETGLTEEQIDKEDMSIGTFKIEIEDFKSSCRVLGFKILQTPEGHFVAQDPRRSDFALGRQQLEDSIYESEWPTYLDTFTERMSANHLREHVFEMEGEINGLLDIHKRSGADDESSPKRDRFRSKQEEEKLIRLLRGFFPLRITTAYRQLRSPVMLLQPISTAEKAYEDQRKATATKTFIDVYEPWLRRLTQSGVHIVLGSKDNVEDNNDGILYMNCKRKPNSDIDTTSEKPLHEEDNTTELLPPDLQNIQDEINNLLRLRRSRDLDLSEEKRLRCLLRILMPKGLGRLDDVVRSIGEIARSRCLSEHEATRYFIEADWWRDDYYGWLSEFTKTGIRIKQSDIGEPFPPATSNIMFLQLAPDQLPNESSETPSLPLHIQKAQDLLNRFLSGKVDITKVQKEECESYLYSFWRPIGEDIRQRWYDNLSSKYRIKPHGGLVSEPTRFQAVVEAQILNSFSAFLEQVMGRGSQKLRLKFIETQPETFTLVLDSGQSEDNVQSDTMLRDVINNVLTIQSEGSIVFDVLNRALEEFLRLARKIRPFQTESSTKPLTDAEREQVRGLVQPLSTDGVAIMENEITKLWQDSSTKGNVSKADQDRLHDLSVRQMWYMWASMNPGIRDLLPIESMPQPEPLQTLLNPMLHGAVQPDPPDIDPPTEADIRDLEATIDDLLDKYRNNWLTAIEKSQFEWLLRPLSPPELQNLDKQIQDLRWKSVRPLRLDTNESLKLVAFQADLRQLFHQWISQIKSFETLLNGWWFNPGVMQQLFIHARQWDDAMADAVKYGLETDPKAPGEPHKNASRQNDLRLRIEHENYELLRQFAENFEGSGHAKLLLEHMDPPLKALHEEIQSLRDRARSSPLQFDESLRLRIVTQDFVRDHMNWVASLTVRNIFCPLPFIADGVG